MPPSLEGFTVSCSIWLIRSACGISVSISNRTILTRQLTFVSSTCDNHPKETCEAISDSAPVCFPRVIFRCTPAHHCHHHRLELSRSIGNDSALLGLLRTYKEHYPDVILYQPTGKGATFAVRTLGVLSRRELV